MGYRNNVVCVLTKEANEEALNKINDLKFIESQSDGKNDPQHLQKLIKDTINTAKTLVDEETGDIAYLWDDVKWYYEDELDIKILQDILTSNTFDDILFIRQGDDLTDLEEIGFYYNNPFGIELVTKIKSKDGDVFDLPFTGM